MTEQVTKLEIWQKLAENLPSASVSWRQDGRPTARDGKFLARFVAYVEAGTVRERLDAVVPGAWDLTLEPLPVVQPFDQDSEAVCAFKARLQIMGTIREDVGQGKDYKSAATDAFKRAAVRFGIGHELYAMDPMWVPVDGDSKYAKPLEDPAAVYAKRNGGHASAATERHGAPTAANAPQQVGTAAKAPAPPQEGDVIHDGTGDPKVVGEPSCPKCGGRLWDNRLTKKNPKAPDYKCRDRSCDGVIWPAKGNAKQPISVGNIAGLDDDGYSEEPPF